jgi:deoxyinosine 3'endonuclease (endonuclease V)
MTVPYIPGFLAFREVDHFMNLLKRNKVKGQYRDRVIKRGSGF